MRVQKQFIYLKSPTLLAVASHIESIVLTGNKLEPRNRPDRPNRASHYLKVEVKRRSSGQVAPYLRHTKRWKECQAECRDNEKHEPFHDLMVTAAISRGPAI